MADAKIVAVGLLTQQNLDTLGPTLQYAWPVEETPRFRQLLLAIDEVDRDQRERGVEENWTRPK